MKWQGRQESDNVEDRRGMSRGKVAIGGGIGTIVIDQVESACGEASSANGPFYCPGDHKVYLDLSFLDEMKSRFGAYGDFAVAYVIAHEIGHHVQNQLGILEKVNARRARSSQSKSNSRHL